MKPDQALQEAVESVMLKWSNDTIIALKKSIEEKNLHLSGDLSKSLASIAYNDDERAIASVSLIFNTYGRYKDMDVYYRTPPPLAAMEAFVRKVGISNFQYVSGYAKEISPVGVSANSTKLDADDYVVKRIARAIGYSMYKGGGQKAKEWYNVTIRKQIGKLRGLLRTELEKHLAEEIRKEFNLKLNG
jgi:hypothetical protein